VERHGIQKVELFAPMPDHGEKVGGFENLEVLGHGLTGHVEMGAEFRQRLPVGLVQLVEELTAARVSEGFEYVIHQWTPLYATNGLHVKYD